MFKKNMSQLDRTLRCLGGVALILIGLFLLGGWQGNPLGILVAVLGVAPLLVTSLTGFCPGYIPFGISTLGRKPNSIKPY